MTFKELLDKQSYLESKIKHIRERTLDDICLSFVAELIEFNEETKESHKTWKVKEYNEKAMKEEAVDLLFFLLQFCLELEIEEITELASYWKFNWEIARETGRYFILNFIRTLVEPQQFASFKAQMMMADLVTLYKLHNITEREVYEIYEEKYQKNLKRIGTEWN